ncbi:site-2 protease family protein [Paenibacillus sp. YPG26]|uniref:site-2 protease family protein n=1 Tax=Paenibacillus sp. YPG26 TaxID=2878915 RepID=UPI002040EC09|nr:site-2 protease family protein [Paenibacillus sp. YPG26]USB32959.1 site-2 protease family protein [Paenibacillus sp. YPG26]
MEQQQHPKTRKKNSLWWLGSLIALILAKGKTLLAVLKFSKLGGALISMAVSIGAYALIYPWGFAVGFVALLFVHELGHVIAAKRKGLPVSAPLFIPFLGALITMKRNPRDAQTEAYIALGGPILGSLGALAMFAAAYYLDSPLLYALANVGFFLNLLNLLPIHPLDGGRIATAVTRWLWLVGLIGGLYVIILLKSFLFFIIWVMFAFDLYGKYGRQKKQAPRSLRGTFQVPVEHLREQGYLIPGTGHRRELPFTTYSELDGQQYVKAIWEGLDFEGLIALPQQGLIQKVQVVQIEHVEKEDGLHLAIQCQVEYEVFENNKYYDVPVASRIGYGITYVLLAAGLAGMMYVVHQVSDLTL